MSALGQKRTSEHVRVMSAFPSKADIGTQSWNVRFVPKADITATLRKGRPHCDDVGMSALQRYSSCHGLRVQFSALRKFLSEQSKLFATACATAPDETNFARRLLGKERAGDETGPEQKAGLDG